MALLKPTLLFNVVKRSLSSSQVVLASHWNKDWKPGPYPVTEEEKAAAAKKYGLLREEYQPIPDDGDGAGDYPDFKPYSVEGRDMFYPWDYPDDRRNFGEALHEDANLYTEDRWEVDMKPRYSMKFMLAWFFSVMGITYWLTIIGKDTFFIPALPQHRPAPGITHYKYPSSQ